MKFRVLYQTSKFFRQFGGGFGETKVTIDKLAETHRELRIVETDSLDSLYREQQAENWAKDYEATNALLQSKGLAHTSMSVGDVAENIETGEVFAVANIGFTLLNPGGKAGR